MANDFVNPLLTCIRGFLKPALLLVLFICGSKANAAVNITGPDSACAGATANYSITAAAGSTYNWFTTNGNIPGNASGNSVAVVWDTAGAATISVTITDINNNVTTGFLNISIRPNPHPNITWPLYPTCPSDTQDHQGTSGQGGATATCINVCKNSIKTYTTASHTGSTYQWIVTGATSFTGQGTNSITVNWNSTGTGSVTVVETNQWGCFDSSQICITKQDLPVAAFNTQVNVCLNQVDYFTNQSTGATSYQWSFGDGATSTLTNPSHMYGTAGTYTVTLVAMNDCHCTDTARRVITVDSHPGPEIECPATVCAGDTQTYTTNAPGCVYHWFVTGGTIVSGLGTPAITVAWGPGMIGTIKLFVTGCGSFCTDTTTVTIPIIPSVATITGQNKVCPGDCETYSLPPFMGATFNWYISGTGGGVITTQCCGQVTVCWPAYAYFGNDTLTVSYLDSFLNCGGTGSIVIHVRPHLSLNATTTVCANSVTTISNSPGINCNWAITPAGPTFTGNGTPSIQVNWSNLPGNYTVTAYPLNPNQTCSDSATVKIKAVAVPAKPVITGDTIVCPNTVYSYCATGSNVTWIITGGTPATGHGSCISVTWGPTGPYLIQAYQQQSAAPNCPSDTTSQVVHSALPIGAPNITGPSNVCANGTNTFVNTVTYPGYATLTWSISPPNTGSITGGQGTNSVTVQWGNNAPSTPTITLTVSMCSQTQSSTKPLTLFTAPTPVITINGIFCPGTSVTFSTTAYSGYQWSGPSFTSTTNPSGPATLAGNYHLTVTDANGCTGTTTKLLTALPGPVASISTADPTSYCIGTPFTAQLNALANPGYTYAWSNGSTTNPTTISAAGTYRVTVTDIHGCTSLSNAIVITVDTCHTGSGGPCVPNGSISFIHPTFYGCNPLSFTNTSVNASTYTWYFGDGFTSNATNGVHTYASAGFYLVTLSGYVRNAAGSDSCVLTDTAQVKVPLAPAFTYTTGCATDSVCFTDISTYTPGNNITSWVWTFGDTYGSSTQNPCHKYATGGNYTVTLTVSDGTCSSTKTLLVHVITPPVAAFTFTNPSCVNSNIPFTDASTPVGAINLWSWNFGDAGVSLNQNPNHSYSSPGTDTVHLAVRDTSGCKDTAMAVVTVVSANIPGIITAYPDTIVCANTNVHLHAPVCTCTYLWSTGGTTDSIVVSTSGTYTVTITDANGCKGTKSIHILVNPGPVVSISNSGADKFCLGGYTYLTAFYSVNYLYLWSSNDLVNNGSTAAMIVSYPSVPGVYHYSVAITDTTTGCSDTSLPYIITVTDTPVSPIVTVIGAVNACQGDTITLIASNPDTSAHIHWSNGAVGDTNRVTSSGCYTAIVVDSNGCDKSTKVCVTINPLPDICPFWTGCLDTCSPYVIHGPPGNATYQWLRNGLPIAGATSQNYTATINGAYSLILTNSFGCFDTTGVLNLTLHSCDTCARIVTDSVHCNGQGQYTYWYHVVNNSGHTINQINLLIQAPYLNALYSPVTTLDSIPDGGTSAEHSATLYNMTEADHPCFVAHIQEMDENNQELFCCNSDSGCVTLPPCDSNCCYLHILGDSIWCSGTNPEGLNTYGFQVHVKGCGNLQLTTSHGTITTATHYHLTNSDTLITGSFTQTQPVGNSLCLGFTLYNNGVACHDTSICMPLPNCDTNCCYLHFISDSVKCRGVDTAGNYLYGFKLWVNGCGHLNLITPQGTITSTTSFALTPGNTLITGTFTDLPVNNGMFCLGMVMLNATVVCTDTTVCIPLPVCDSVPVLPQCYLEHPDSICAGHSASFMYTGSTAGHTFAWTFTGGTPATATGAGPNIVTYNTPGCYPVQVIIYTGNHKSVCYDTICVIAPPVASITHSGNTLNAFPAGMNYQWNSGPPSYTPIAGAVNQFYSPPASGVYCVVVSNRYGCADTVCTDFVRTGIDQLDDAFNWQVVPNPNNGNFELVIHNTTGEKMSYTITNAIGQEIMRHDFETTVGDVTKVSVSHIMAAGIYVIKLESDKISVVGKMVVK